MQQSPVLTTPVPVSRPPALARTAQGRPARGDRGARRHGRIHERPAGGRTSRRRSRPTAGRCTASGLAAGSTPSASRSSPPGLEPGDEVVVPAQTFVATYEAVTQAGGRPLVADVSEADYGLDAEAAEAVIGPRTRFLMPVHLYGQMADMRALASRRRSATGWRSSRTPARRTARRRDGLRAGAAGLAGAFSFYPGKNLGAFGDAGALVTDDEELASRVRALREHGQSAKYVHELEGYTSRLDTIQALVLLRKLALLDGWNEERQGRSRLLRGRPRGSRRPRAAASRAGSEPVWHLYVVRTEAPTELADFLRERGIGTGRHYPYPPHLSPAYARLGHATRSVPGRRGARSAVPLAPALPRHAGGAARGRRRRDRRLLRPWPLARSTRRPTASSPTSTSARASSSRRSRTSTAAASVTARASARSSRSSAEPSSAPAARSRATPSSATGSRSGRGLRRPRGRLRQRQACPGRRPTKADLQTEEDWTLLPDRGRATGLARLRRGRPRGPDDRRGRARRRRRGRHADVAPGAVVVGNPARARGPRALEQCSH